MKILTKNTAAALLTLGLGIGVSSIQTAQAQAAAPIQQAPALNVGDPIPADALDGVTWVQGEAVKALNEKGKTYIIECWATWCGPCIAVIPHVNELHKKFEDKGLVIIGMNVFEEGLEKSEKFVKKQGDGMSYRVAYSGGRSSAFADKVLKPAGVTGIPRALIIQDGKLALSIHPGSLDDQMIGSLLDGSFDAKAFAEKQAKEEAERKAFIAKLLPLQKAGDWAGVKELAQGLEDSNPMKFSLIVLVATKTSNWPDLIAIRNDITSGKHSERIKPSMLDASVAHESTITEGAKTYSDLALAGYAELAEDAKPMSAVQHHFAKARMHYMSEQIEEAKAELKVAASFLDKLEDPRAKGYFSTLVNNAIKKVDEGSFPNFTELMKK